jgi:hypothetical protein
MAPASRVCVLALVWTAACGASPDPGDPTDSGVDAGAPLADARTGPPTVRVLFIGNSFTNYNDLPSVLARLGEAPQSPVRFEVAQHTPGGENWQGHDADPRVDELIQEGWDYVVLQDQSVLPFWDLPAVGAALLSLDAKIRATSARTVLFMTWAYEDGGFYQEMRVDSYYVRASEATGALVAPVGRAWERALRDPSITLHLDDGQHPNEHGTYLAACVFYATLTEESPLGLGDGGLGIEEAQAAVLQRVAWDAIAARQRPSSPPLGRWPLSATGADNDLIPAGDLVLGDAVGPDGSASSATRFTPTAYAGVPYFVGLNTPRYTVSLEVYREDWAQPTEHGEHLAGRPGVYAIHLDGTALTADVFVTPDEEEAPARLDPVMPDPPPPSTRVAFEAAGLGAGWHRVTLTHDGLVERLWVDGENVASTPAIGTATCAALGPGCDGGVVLGVESEIATVRSASRVPELAFTGALADLQVYGTALTAEEIGAL